MEQRHKTPADLAAREPTPFSLRAAYVNAPQGAALATIAVGGDAIRADALSIASGLDVLDGAPLEVWSSDRDVTMGESGDVRFAANDECMMACMALAEREAHLESLAEYAYRRMLEFNAQRRFPHLLRIWNYFDAINEGAGDFERYRRFCVGRARALTLATQQLPAATAIGRKTANGTLLIYWLAARRSGIAIENPRQVSAYRYPKQYGPAAPQFARATLAPNGPLFISGTASIVGHVSQHEGDLRAQLTETLRNLDAVLQRARQHSNALPAQFGRTTLLKVYLRHREDLPAVQTLLRDRFGDAVPTVYVAADICRRELLIEVDCVHDISRSSINGAGV